MAIHDLKEYLADYLGKIAPLSGGLFDEISARSKLLHCKPHQILFTAGQVEDRICLLVSGFARSYYYDDFGAEQTIRFFSPGSIVFSYQGFWSETSKVYTEVLEHTDMITLSYDDFKQLLLKYQETQMLMTAILKRHQDDLHYHQQLATLSAEDRFKAAKKAEAEIFRKAPLKMIASYLYMSRETLSRIIARA